MEISCFLFIIKDWHNDHKTPSLRKVLPWKVPFRAYFTPAICWESKQERTGLLQHVFRTGRERRGAERGSGTPQATTLSKQRLSESHTFQVKSYTTAIHYNSQKSTSGLLLALPLAFPRLRFGVFIFLARQTSVSDVDKEREEDEAGELDS